MCIFQKSCARYSDKLFQNLKRGAVSWDQLFSVHFFVRNMGKIVPPPNKNSDFFKSTKTVFTVLKDRSFFCNLSEKFRLYRYTFNTVKTVFVDLKKTHFFLGGGTIFPIFLTKKMYRKKLVPRNCPSF